MVSTQLMMVFGFVVTLVFVIQVNVPGKDSPIC